MIDSMESAIRYIFQTRRRLDKAPRGLDEYTRDTAPTRRLLGRAGLPKQQRESIVITGSRGKGSASAITAKLLSAMGRRPGTITSPHLVHWNERIRVAGRMIPSRDFSAHPARAAAAYRRRNCWAGSQHQYLSPQGIFLAIALRWFDEQRADIAVLEVGRGGRFDDIAVVPNQLALFTPIMLEHTALLGASLARIAWHKAGIIQPGGAAISLPQADEAAAELHKEAALQDAQLTVLREDEVAAFVSRRADGQSYAPARLWRAVSPTAGAVSAGKRHAGHPRCRTLRAGRDRAASGISGGADGRDARSSCRESPRIVIDGAITPDFRAVLCAEPGTTLRAGRCNRWRPARPRLTAVFISEMAAVCDALIITETDINPSTRFPAQARCAGCRAPCLR